MYLLVNSLRNRWIVFHRVNQGLQFKLFCEVNAMFKRKFSEEPDHHEEKAPEEQTSALSFNSLPLPRTVTLDSTGESKEPGLRGSSTSFGPVGLEVKDVSSYHRQTSVFFKSDEPRYFMKIREYVEQHGFGPTTPDLVVGLSPGIFLKHYYDKKTLLEFCRDHRIPSHGQKNELTTRIEHFLRTGKILNSNAQKKSTLPFDSELGLRLDRQVVNYKSDPVTRRFFERHIPGFTGFSAYVQK